MDLRRTAVMIAAASIAVHFTISGNLLTDLGVAYISDGGCLVEKIHPGSILAIAAGALSLASGAANPGDPARPSVRETAIFAFLAGIGFCALQALFLTGPGGVIALLDTFLPAGCVALALNRSTCAEHVALRTMLQCLFFMNAIIAVGEAALQDHLVPLVSDAAVEAEFRPTALYDHPLTGASASMIGLFLQPCRHAAPGRRLAYQAALIASLFAFGERMPLAAAMLASLLFNTFDIAFTLLARRSAAPSVAAAFKYLILAAVIAATAAGAGLGERLATHLYWDPSAQVRLSVLGILDQLDSSQFLFGIARTDLMALIEPMRLQTGARVIENFWLVMLLNLGVIGFPAFAAAMVALARWLWRTGDRNGRIMVVALMLTASTSNSLGRKSMLLVALVAAVLATRPAMPQAVRTARHPAFT